MSSHLHITAKPMKRLRQLAYLCRHPLHHFQCALAVRKSRIASGRMTSLKYLGDHLALSLGAPQRRRALASHYELLPGVLRSTALEGLRDGLLIWQKAVGDRPALSIILEPSSLAPMEGELQLRFSYRSDLCVLTFLIASGDVFGAGPSPILFIGGMQGRFGGREELREASRLNGEISPAAMLLLTVQALGRAMGVREILAIGEDDHISLGYTHPRFNFDYRRIWTEAGGVRRGFHYGIPFETPSRPIKETPRSHRSRTRRKRVAKRILRRSIENRLSHLIRSPLMTLLKGDLADPTAPPQRLACSG